MSTQDGALGAAGEPRNEPLGGVRAERASRSPSGASRRRAGVFKRSTAQYVMQTYGRAPVTFVRGEGTLLYDDTGKEYLDFLSGLAVTSLGHAHPEVAEAISAQASKLLHVSNLYYNEHQPHVAAALDNLLGGGGRVFFANSGGEANESRDQARRAATASCTVDPSGSMW